MKMEDMVQFTVTGVENVMEFIDIVRKEVLYDDEFWHFFNEEEEGIFLRCSTKFTDDLLAYLKLYDDCEFTWKPYKDDHPIVERFMWYFKRVFHLNALMAIEFYNGITEFTDENPKPDNFDTMILSAFVGSITERLSHCFLNNLQDHTYSYRLQSRLRFGDDSSWESYILAEHMIDRSMWTGMRKAYLNAVEKKEKEINDTEQER
jgi:hypothetical protein